MSTTEHKYQKAHAGSKTNQSHSDEISSSRSRKLSIILVDRTIAYTALVWLHAIKTNENC